MNATNLVHGTGNFLSWHRYYIHSFETALSDECGFAGALPYWNWARSALDPINSPYMDGSPLSQGGNGDWAPHNCTRSNAQSPCRSPVVEGRGGGCVTTGPYANRQANISSVQCSFDFPNVEPGPFLGYSPRCIRRDIMPEYTRLLATEEHLLELLTSGNLSTIGAWQDALQSPTGLHGVGHYTYGGDPGGDVYTSPNE